MNTGNSSRTRESSEIVAALASNLAELTKKTANFEQLRSMLPLVADLKRADINNKQMSQILKVMNEAIPKLKSTYGSTSRSSQNFTNMLDRMVGQLKQEYIKLQQSLQEIQGKHVVQQQKGNQNTSKEGALLIEQIERVVSANLKKLEEQIKKQSKSLGKESQSICLNPYQFSILKSKVMQITRSNEHIEQCKTILGQIRCYVDLKQEENIQDNNMDEEKQRMRIRENIDNFIKVCNLHFDRQVNIILEKLRMFQKSDKLSIYQEKIWNHFNCMGNRLKIRLQSAIIKLTFSIQEFQQVEKEKDIIKKWKETSARWQLTLNMIKSILQ